MQGNRLHDLPHVIGTLHLLKDLNLQANRLARIQGSIGSLKKLRSLNLKSNQLVSLSPAIGNLGALRKLDLSNNTRLKTLPREICQLNVDVEIVCTGNRHLMQMVRWPLDL